MLVHLLSLDDQVIHMSICAKCLFFTKTEYGFDDLLLTVRKHKRMRLYM